MRISVLVLVSVLAGVSTAWAEVPKEVLQDVDTVFGYLEDFGRVASEHTGDCKAMDAAVERWLEKNAHRVEQVQEAVARLESLPTDKQKLVEAEVESRAQAFIESMMKIMDCMQEPNMTAAMEVMSPRAASKEPVTREAPQPATHAQVGGACKRFEARIEELCAPGQELDASLCEGLRQSWAAMREAMATAPDQQQTFDESCIAVLEALAEIEQSFPAK
ncbi:MAG: hypothetical protein RBU37_21715 [Myxococcota bacterium]|jgi:hypothetical protein|nr:hypothetical protein [Myxococcota bacterium]